MGNFNDPDNNKTGRVGLLERVRPNKPIQVDTLKTPTTVPQPLSAAQFSSPPVAEVANTLLQRSGKPGVVLGEGEVVTEVDGEKFIISAEGVRAIEPDAAQTPQEILEEHDAVLTTALKNTILPGAERDTIALEIISELASRYTGQRLEELLAAKDDSFRFN
ncbi:MAG: hypothetical protein R3A13_02320 [Bdellovibrionota bacterium]